MIADEERPQVVRERAEPRLSQPGRDPARLELVDESGGLPDDLGDERVEHMREEEAEGVGDVVRRRVDGRCLPARVPGGPDAAPQRRVDDLQPPAEVAASLKNKAAHNNAGNGPG